jgi:hypothetical protein
VAREVRRLLPKTPDQESDKAYRTFRKLLESAQSEYKKAHAMLEEGELQGFMVANDRKSAKQKERLIATLEKFSATLDADVLTLQEIAKDEIASGCLPDLLCFRQCGRLIQWTCLRAGGQPLGFPWNPLQCPYSL